MQTEARKKYGDIIDLPHYVDPNHPQMTRLNRAAQFSPFSALTGYEDLIAEAARETDGRAQLDESEKEEIEKRINALLNAQTEAVFNVFVADAKKAGGKYETAHGRIQKYDPLNKTLLLDSGKTVFIEDIAEVLSDPFDR